MGARGLKNGLDGFGRPESRLMLQLGKSYKSWLWLTISAKSQAQMRFSAMHCLRLGRHLRQAGAAVLAQIGVSQHQNHIQELSSFA